MVDEVDPALRLLWPEEGPTRRGPRPKLSLDRVATAAIAVADAEGLDAVTMQRVADDLGAAKMALYRHVPGKAELVAVMLDRALGAPPAASRRGAGGWREQLRRWALAMHERLAARPWALAAVIDRRTPGPHELEWFERGLIALRDTALEPAERLDTLAVLANHVRGIVTMAAGAAAGDAEEALASSLAPVLERHADRFPETAAAFAAPAARRDDALRYGVERILDGVEALMAGRGRTTG